MKKPPLKFQVFQDAWEPFYSSLPKLSTFNNIITCCTFYHASRHKVALWNLDIYFECFILFHIHLHIYKGLKCFQAHLEWVCQYKYNIRTYAQQKEHSTLPQTQTTIIRILIHTHALHNSEHTPTHLANTPVQTTAQNKPP